MEYACTKTYQYARWGMSWTNIQDDMDLDLAWLYSTDNLKSWHYFDRRFADCHQRVYVFSDSSDYMLFVLARNG